MKSFCIAMLVICLVGFLASIGLIIQGEILIGAVGLLGNGLVLLYAIVSLRADEA